uniref:Uncharacterized protein n=1 Tax=Pyrodinium bahamense TaxID=73915 RepID=A0A7S0FLH2_9DINO|mmetsp:Transcript_370/g.959  ORF Transcript_370/g.959 Transcript_370/m.959 type:complete len:144 (+) Transcript_370:1-432(+)
MLFMAPPREAISTPATTGPWSASGIATVVGQALYDPRAQVSAVFGPFGGQQRAWQPPEEEPWPAPSAPPDLWQGAAHACRGAAQAVEPWWPAAWAARGEACCAECGAALPAGSRCWYGTGQYADKLYCYHCWVRWALPPNRIG